MTPTWWQLFNPNSYVLRPFRQLRDLYSPLFVPQYGDNGTVSVFCGARINVYVYLSATKNETGSN